MILGTEMNFKTDELLILIPENAFAILEAQGKLYECREL